MVLSRHDLPAMRGAGFGSVPLRGAVADVRALPFRDADVRRAVLDGELSSTFGRDRANARSARSASAFSARPEWHRAVIGVPNRHGPFLRPALAAPHRSLLDAEYATAYEEVYHSRRAWRRILERCWLRRSSTNLRLLTCFAPGWLLQLCWISGVTPPRVP